MGPWPKNPLKLGGSPEVERMLRLKKNTPFASQENDADLGKPMTSPGEPWKFNDSGGVCHFQDWKRFQETEAPNRKRPMYNMKNQLNLQLVQLLYHSLCSYRPVSPYLSTNQSHTFHLCTISCTNPILSTSFGSKVWMNQLKPKHQQPKQLILHFMKMFLMCKTSGLAQVLITAPNRAVLVVGQKRVAGFIPKFCFFATFKMLQPHTEKKLMIGCISNIFPPKNGWKPSSIAHLAMLPTKNHLHEPTKTVIVLQIFTASDNIKRRLLPWAPSCMIQLKLDPSFRSEPHVWKKWIPTPPWKEGP